MKEWNYKPGDWWLFCDSCGKKIKASNSRHRWDGFIVCDGCFEHRHPQDFVKTKNDKITVPFSRPRTEDTFIDVSYIIELSCTPTTSSCMADFGTANCATVGNVLQGLL